MGVHLLFGMKVFVIIIVDNIILVYFYIWGFPGGSVIKNQPANAGGTGDLGSVLGSGRSPGRGNCNPFQYLCLGSPMDRRGWWAAVHRVAKSRARLST